VSGIDRLERDLAVWFEDTAVPRVPDYVDEIVREAVRGRQRPRWSFVGRWLPTPIAGLRLPSLAVRWRTIAILAALLALLVAGAVYVGSRPKVPPPFGLAANGLVIVDRNGDIVAFDPVSRTEVPLVVGPELDYDPMWSPDGTKFVFLRDAGTSARIGFANQDGGGTVLSEIPLPAVDSDSVSWKPDSSGVAALAAGVYFFIDAATGKVSGMQLEYPELEVHWRPPDGHQIVYRSVSPTGVALVLHSLQGGGDSQIVVEGNGQIRPRGFSPDGKRFVYHTIDANDTGQETFVYDLETKETTPIGVVTGRLSNDGTRIAGYHYGAGIETLCVAPATGGDCRPVGESPYPIDATHSDALNWSPNDEWLIVYPRNDTGVVLVDPNGIHENLEIAADGAGSWQRRAASP
jgi:WD40-like Beta Propeller Repeat